ncbi:MAG TPA: hypothetical protein PKY29_02255 [Ferruginibacter sp.]|nr:hypothetical protein [Ferruginibacter sp.]HRO17711.1 hypothetical protein [Ferruginibacter sp.]HRQ20104.1 hypothetical protein [Ferruginibacter sp.]
MKKLMICLFAVAIASPIFAQTKRTATKRATPVAATTTGDEFPAALKLTDEQKEKIRNIDEEIANRMNSSERTPDKQAQMEEKMKMYRLEKIRNILTPEQQVVFDEQDKIQSDAGKKSIHQKMVAITYEDIIKRVDLSDAQREELKSTLTVIDEKLEKSAVNADEMKKLQQHKLEILQKVLSEEQLEKLNESMQ